MDSVKPTESQSEPVLAGGGMVGSGSGGKPLKRAENASNAIAVCDDSETEGYNVTTKDGRRPKGTHPDPNLAATVGTMALAGFTVKQVCAALKLSAETLAKHYDDEMKHGRTNVMTQVVGSLAQRAISGSDTAAIWLTKTRLGWTDRQNVELTGKDGGPIEIQMRTETLGKLASLLERSGDVIEGEFEEKKSGPEPAE